MTISSIHLENFQSHEDSKVVLSPGVNVIIGPSDSGKTAIVRALRWVTWNRPQGEAFRSSWGGDTLVSVELDDGVAVCRARAKNLNAYYIDDQDYHAFAADVPSDVTDALNIHSVNLQQQLDRPFLLDSHPSQVAQYLNEVAHLDIIDTALGRLSKWIRALEAELRNHKKNQERLIESQASFKYLPDMESNVEKLEEQEAALRDRKAKRVELANVIDQALSVKRKLDRTKPLLGLASLVEAALGHMDTKRELQKDADLIYDLFTRMGRIDRNRKKIAPLQQLGPVVDKAIEQHEVLERVQTSAHKLAAVIANCERIGKQALEAKEKHGQLQDEFNEGMGDTCLLCGSVIQT